jgi:hypothetical protein
MDELRAAADALKRGDPGPFADLIADECEWRDGKIVDMQGCATRKDAERFARRKRDVG